MVRGIAGAVPRCMGLLAALPALAQRVEGDRAGASGVFEAEVPVNSQTDTERNNGFARALAQVLAKISGDRAATARPGVGQELRRAKDYVVQLRLPPGPGRVRDRRADLPYDARSCASTRPRSKA